MMPQSLFPLAEFRDDWQQLYSSSRQESPAMGYFDNYLLFAYVILFSHVGNRQLPHCGEIGKKLPRLICPLIVAVGGPLLCGVDERVRDRSYSLFYVGLCCKNVNVKCSYSELIIANPLLVSWLFSFVFKEARPGQNVQNVSQFETNNLASMFFNTSDNFIDFFEFLLSLELFFLKPLFTLRYNWYQSHLFVYFLNIPAQSQIATSPKDFALFWSIFPLSFCISSLIFLSPSCSLFIFPFFSALFLHPTSYL